VFLYTRKGHSNNQSKETIPFTAASKRISQLGKKTKETQDLHSEHYKTPLKRKKT
jgi:hypothetical protein